jgi:SAM-dependent methyltransferase
VSRFDQYVAKQFADPSGVGGSLITAVMSRQNRPLYEATLALLPSDAARVLDVGCGNGQVMALLAGNTQGALVGVDPSAGAIAAALRRNRARVADGRMAFARGSAESTGQPGGSVDAAYSVNTVYFWPDLEAGFIEIARVLKPGGLFVNALYTAEELGRHSHTEHGYRKYKPSELVAAASAAGFTAQSVPLLAGRAFSVRCLKPAA